MRLIDYHPEWRTADPRTVIDQIGSENLFLLLEATSTYYEENLPLWRVLNHYGVDNVFPDSTDAYVPCLLPSHGGDDKHASARYFATDRNTGETKPAFYCYKCQKRKSAFWYVYDLEHCYRDRSIRDCIRFVYEAFRVPPPLELWFQFDPGAYLDSFDGGSGQVDPTPLMQDAIRLRTFKQVDVTQYLARVRALLVGGTASADEAA